MDRAAGVSCPDVCAVGAHTWACELCLSVCFCARGASGCLCARHPGNALLSRDPLSQGRKRLTPPFRRQICQSPWNKFSRNLLRSPRAETHTRRRAHSPRPPAPTCAWLGASLRAVDTPSAKEGAQQTQPRITHPQGLHSHKTPDQTRGPLAQGLQLGLGQCPVRVHPWLWAAS